MELKVSDAIEFAQKMRRESRFDQRQETNRLGATERTLGALYPDDWRNRSLDEILAEDPDEFTQRVAVAKGTGPDKSLRDEVTRMRTLCKEAKVYRETGAYPETNRRNGATSQKKARGKSAAQDEYQGPALRLSAKYGEGTIPPLTRRDFKRFQHALEIQLIEEPDEDDGREGPLRLPA